MKAFELRESFLKFFEAKQHQRFKSASLIPLNDPTLFFTNAGMVPFKNVFTGQESVGTSRAASSQKCMRVSGKHNDLENVGRTLRHHTFFEMLGNFSFGDYFKASAIEYAWEYLTEVLKISKAKLWVTVFEKDDEAAALWTQHTDISPDRVLRRGAEDNFWSMGATGPCGPCTEIYFDHGKQYGCGQAKCVVGCDCDRYMEIWNLVFMQFNRDEQGQLHPLPKPSVDTGMGLERLACVLQGVHSNYDSDLFTPLLDKIASISGKSYLSSEQTDISMRVIADHIRAATFLISEGVLPSNEGRGYVLRRIIRRALRHGRLLGLHKPFFYLISEELISQMQSAYPELNSHQKFIQEVLRAEENRFLETLERGLEMIEGEITGLKKKKKSILSGEVAFKLYDTFGFPLDLTENIALESGLTVDLEGFQQLMERQKTTARAAWKGSGEERQAEVHQTLSQEGLKSEFLGYQSLKCVSKVIALIAGGKRVQTAKQGDEVEIYTEHSPFYARSGGQVGDKGQISHASFKAEISDTTKPLKGLIAHLAKVLQGSVSVGDEVQLQVSPAVRIPIQLNHTATHLLHAALRRVLGEHVKQAGSLVAENRLRFDFSHFKALTKAQIEEVEDLVNQKIREDLVVEKTEMHYEEAMRLGAMALFGEKYGDQVRVLKIADFSTELCGGTHISRTGEIGLFKITFEASVASGVRRIEAVTGGTALRYFRNIEELLENIARVLKTTPSEVLSVVTKQANELQDCHKQLKKNQVSISKTESFPDADDFLSKAREIKGVQVLSLRYDLDDMRSLRVLSDKMIQKLGSGISVLGSVNQQDKVALIIRVSKDLTKRYSATDLVNKLAPMVGGSGGGRADMAQAGGTQVAGLDKALREVFNLI